MNRNFKCLYNRELRLAVFVRALAVSALAVSALALITACGKQEAPESGAPDLANADAYTLEVVKDRKMKDLHFLRDESSPLRDGHKELFQELAYYPVSRDYAYYTALEPLATPEIFVIATSKDKPREMLHIGHLPFAINGKDYKLAVFMPKDTSDGAYWFIPFTDATSGKDTYGGGRYIDIDHPADSVFLDFNYAYNPYCAYNDNYDCPIPPAENRLPIAIKAGEKKYALKGQ